MEAGAKTQEAKTAGDEDLSMEEILQSIRKIIADDDKGGEKTVADNAKAEAKPKEEGKVPGSEVLELTEMLKEDGTVVSLKGDAAKPAEAKPSGDVLGAIDKALAPEKPAEKPTAPAAAPVAAAAPAAAATVAAAAAPAAPKGDALLSTDAAVAAATAIKKLQNAADPELPPVATTPTPFFRSGNTVEDMVAKPPDMLKPMMKWRGSIPTCPPSSSASSNA